METILSALGGCRASYIAGQFVSRDDLKTLPIFYPGDNRQIGEQQIADAALVDQAVTSAREAQGAWAEKTGTERGRILRKAAELLRQRNDELARIEVADTGKPISEALEVDVQTGADALEYFGGVAASVTGDTYQLGKDFAYTRREPYGVVASIGAWNYPLQIACWKAAPALAAGNAVVFKPSELTPLNALNLAQIFLEAGLPPGVFNVVLGDGSTGHAICSHPDVRKLSLTGSVPTGQKVMAAASKSLAPVTLELGGKSPLIIFEDADIQTAVDAAFVANFYTQGEICSNGTRVFVHEAIREPFEKALLKRLSHAKVGDPFDPQTEIGSLISPQHCERVLQYIASGLEEGAELLTGGRRVGDKGNFVEPTVFGNCRPGMRIVEEEIFGPVMSMLSFRDEDEVVAAANQTPFGLAAGLCTKDLARAQRVSARLQAGICWVNTYNVTPIEIPFGGVKMSGIGRENSLHALHHYTQLKTVYVAGS